MSFIKAFRALSNSRLIQDSVRDEIIAKANNDDSFCLLQQYLNDNGYFQQGDSRVSVMEDPRSDFKVYSFQINYSRTKDTKIAEFIFQIFPKSPNNIFISVSDSENEIFQEHISVDKNRKIRVNSNNFLADLYSRILKMNGISNSIKSIRALSNTSPTEGVERNDIIDRASQDGHFCILKQYLEDNGYLLRGDLITSVMEDPESDFKIYSLQISYTKTETNNSADLLFYIFPYRTDRAVVNFSENDIFKETMSVDKTGKIYSEPSNILIALRDTISTWFTTTFRRD
jgi:hypothetical protein